jgi:ribosome-binding factor A
MGRSSEKPASQRQLRVGEEIRHVLANVFERGLLRDPALVGISVTVTEVQVSPDLRNALAYVTPLGGGDSAAVAEALCRASSFLKREVARAVHLKYVPKLTFAADTSFDYAGHIDNLLHEPEVARDLDHDADDDDGEPDGDGADDRGEPADG